MGVESWYHDNKTRGMPVGSSIPANLDSPAREPGFHITEMVVEWWFIAAERRRVQDAPGTPPRGFSWLPQMSKVEVRLTATQRGGSSSPPASTLRPPAGTPPSCPGRTPTAPTPGPTGASPLRRQHLHRRERQPHLRFSRQHAIASVYRYLANLSQAVAGPQVVVQQRLRPFAIRTGTGQVVRLGVDDIVTLFAGPPRPDIERCRWQGRRQAVQPGVQTQPGHEVDARQACFVRLDQGSHHVAGGEGAVENLQVLAWASPGVAAGHVHQQFALGAEGQRRPVVCRRHLGLAEVESASGRTRQKTPGHASRRGGPGR
jgi:hypothetical protein